MELCQREYDFTASYIELTVFVIIIMLLQILLLLHIVRNRMRQKQKWMSITFIAMQICGIYFTFIDFFRYSIDPHLKFIQKNQILCSIAAYSPKASPILYFVFYLIHILLRLITSFKGSYLAISKLVIFILITSIFLPIPLMILVYLNVTEPACIWRWQPIDLPNASLAVCDWHTVGIANNIISAVMAWVVLLNISISIIFGIKLKKILQASDSAQQKDVLRLKKLSVKNTILSIVVTVSTVINWFMWIVGSAYTAFGISFLYFDLWFNCLIIALMYGYNEKYYNCACRFCIECCDYGHKSNDYAMLGIKLKTQNYGTEHESTQNDE